MGVINDSQLHFVCISLKLVTKKNFQISKNQIAIFKNFMYLVYNKNEREIGGD